MEASCDASTKIRNSVVPRVVVGGNVFLSKQYCVHCFKSSRRTVAVGCNSTGSGSSHCNLCCHSCLIKFRDGRYAGANHPSGSKYVDTVFRKVIFVKMVVSGVFRFRYNMSFDVPKYA